MYSADAESSTTEIEALDLTYKDAIFDSEIRTYLHSEYSSAQPVTDAYSRLFKTIEQHESGSEVAQGSQSSYPPGVHKASLPSLFRDSLAAVRLYLGGATLVKVFPSLVALLLVFSALVQVWPHFVAPGRTTSARPHLIAALILLTLRYLLQWVKYPIRRVAPARFLSIRPQL